MRLACPPAAPSCLRTSLSTRRPCRGDTVVSIGRDRPRRRLRGRGTPLPSPTPAVVQVQEGDALALGADRSLHHRLRLRHERLLQRRSRRCRCRRACRPRRPTPLRLRRARRFATASWPSAFRSPAAPAHGARPSSDSRTASRPTPSFLEVLPTRTSTARALLAASVAAGRGGLRWIWDRSDSGILFHLVTLPYLLGLTRSGLPYVAICMRWEFRQPA